MATPADPSFSRPVVTRVTDVGALVERLDPSRHAPADEYRFSNGRRFTLPEGREYK